MKSNRKLVLFYVFFIVAIIIIGTLAASDSSGDKLTYSDIKQYFTEKQVDSFIVDEDNVLILKLKNKKVIEYKLKYFDVFYEDLNEIIDEQYKDGTITEYDYQPVTELPWWVSILPFVIVIIAFIAMWWYFISKASGKSGSGTTGGGLGGRMNSFSKARTKLGSDEKHKVLFTDVAGADEEKEELKEVLYSTFSHQYHSFHNQHFLKKYGQ